MSFGGFGGFGQNNNNQQSGSAFGGGGFGQNNNTTSSGFGTSNSGGFGQNNSGGGGLFGGNNNQQQNTSSGFGNSGFGSNTTNNAFGANKPAFGSTTTTSTTGGGLFGSSNNTGSTGFGSGGGFGSTTTNSTFGGGGTTGGGLFGGGNNNQAKPAFGASTTGGSSLFGGGNNTNTASSGFGASTGFGAAAGGNDPPGTGNTPFQAYSEKETTTNTTNSFQNIAFQDPYKKWSAEELRLADYAQGRRQGNPSGAGAFGQSSGFGAFGNNNNSTQQQSTGFGAAAKPSGGLFGSSNTTTTGTGFGQSNTGSGFGSTNTNTGGGLFGNNNNTQNKPAGGLFGGGSTTQTQSTGGGLFGSSNTGSGFGSTNTTSGFGSTNNNTGGGLFGNNNNQAKPAGTGFSFGNTSNTNTTNTGSAFGSNNTTGGAFGSNTTSNTGGGLFGGGNNQQQQNTGGGLFGNNNNQQQQSSGGFGSSFGQQNQTQQSGGLFGNKPATTGGGLFGNSTTNTSTGGGLFGGGNNNNQQQQNTGAFGSTNNAAGGGLFGNKPATTGTGLFGNSTTQQSANTGGGLFGGLGNNQQQQQNTGGGLFGGMNNQNQQKPGLFGGSTQSQGGGLFGGSTQNQGGSLFGASNNQQQNQGMGNSLLGNSQQANNAPQGLTANLNDVSAYGSPSLFAGVGGNEVSNPGPLATSLNSNSKPRRGSILPMYKLNPASASRFNTPQKRGFGFSYSNYGTPGASPASSISSTPGGNGSLGRSLLGASTSSSGLSKSMSTNNLRRTYNAEDTILNPGAFSSSSGARWYGSTGSKKLVINRDIRSDLFSTPQKDKAGLDSQPGSRKLAKKVSFDTPNVDAGDGTTPVRAALPAPEDVQEETPRQTRPANNVSNGSKTPEADQPKNTELGIVHEEDNSATPEGNSMTGFDNAPGRYWMSPTMEDLQNMNRMQRQKIDHFTVGRDNVGSIEFKIPVDMSSIDLDEICGGIIQLEPRSATVYPVAAKKPPVGKGLNVPARITLEQSWPRGGRDRRASTDQKRFNKHVERLKRITDTTFESYDKDTGVWIFSVEHFTTYGLDDSDSDDDLEPMDETVSRESAIVDPRQPGPLASEDSDMEDDTFDFRRPRGVPGAFGGQDEMYENEQPTKQPFLGVSSADSAPRDLRLALEEDQDQSDEYDMSDDEEMARSSVEQHHAAEHDDVSSEGGQVTKIGTPGGILRARMRAMKDSAGPVRLEVADGDDWTEMLRKTVSPVKRDRQQLREYNDSPSRQPNFNDADGDETDFRKTSIWQKSVAKPNRMETLAATNRMAAADKGRGFATSIDLMNSLFEKPKPMAQSMRASTSSKGFPKWPYERQDKSLTMDETEQAFHDASRPTWGPSETLVLTTGTSQRFGQTTRDGAGVLAFQRPFIQTDRQSVRLANFSTQSSKKYLQAQDQFTRIHKVKDVPVASLDVSKVKDIFHKEDRNDPAIVQEKRVWELASILFDNDDNSAEGDGLNARKKALSGFWADLVRDSSTKSVGLAATSEEKAVACLAGHRVADACKHLLDGKNFRLGTLVALMGTSDAVKKDMREQLKVWRDSKMLSEFSESIRTIYELLSGNVGVCEGMKGVPAEDRIESFVISSKFGLDWKQAFGLRLWYAIAKQDDLSAAVHKFKNDVDQERESTPRPWFADQGIRPLWQDDDESSRQDLLWGLLQLYADGNTDLEAVLRPENSQLSPFDMRLSWQLGLALVSTGKVSYGTNATEKADATTLAYASQLTSAGEWLEAIFVILHLSKPKARAQAIKEQLCRHAGQIGPESGPNFEALTQKLQIPAAWVWEALALYMRSVKKNASGEVECLLRAGSFEEAHRVLTNEVAPRAVVERDYATLSSLIEQFDGRHGTIPGWSSGGEIYSHFLTLLQQRSKGENTQAMVLDRLQAGLHTMNDEVPETDLMRYAAVSDMADETAKEILKLGRKKQESDLRSKILNLPLTQDRRLAYSMDLGGKRGSEVMSH